MFIWGDNFSVSDHFSVICFFKAPDSSCHSVLNLSNNGQGELEDAISILHGINSQPDTKSLDDSVKMKEGGGSTWRGRGDSSNPVSPFQDLAWSRRCSSLAGPRLATSSAWSLTWAAASGQTWWPYASARLSGIALGSSKDRSKSMSPNRWVKIKLSKWICSNRLVRIDSAK